MNDSVYINAENVHYYKAFFFSLMRDIKNKCHHCNISVTVFIHELTVSYVICKLFVYFYLTQHKLCKKYELCDLYM